MVLIKFFICEQDYTKNNTMYLRIYIRIEHVFFKMCAYKYLK